VTLTLRIDPTGVGGAARDLFSDSGEFAGAMRGMRHRTSVLATVPDAVFLELYAYEVLERAREFGFEAEDVTWRIPFCAEALFAATDVRVHAGRELERMLPEFDKVVVVVASADVLVAESKRVLGVVRFDPLRYNHELEELAGLRGWGIEP
jgi:hypothetical protein